METLSFSTKIDSRCSGQAYTQPRNCLEEGNISVTPMERNESGRTYDSVAKASGLCVPGANSPFRRSRSNGKVPGKVRDFVTD